MSVFSLLFRFRARLRRRESSPAAADHHDSPASRHRGHEILVCLFESVSPTAPQLTRLAPTGRNKVRALSFFCPPVCLSTATRT